MAPWRRRLLIGFLVVVALVLVYTAYVSEVYRSGIESVHPSQAAAARSLGLGTTLTTVIRIHHDDLRRLLDIPEAMEVAALVPMGRPAGRFGVARRKPAAAVTHWERFGDKRPV